MEALHGPPRKFLKASQNDYAQKGNKLLRYLLEEKRSKEILYCRRSDCYPFVVVAGSIITEF